MITDGELALAARAGSEAAFSRLVERHQARLRAFLCRTLGASREEADDVAQETFVAAWAGLARLKEPGGFRLWLFGIGWKKAQDRLRGARRSMARDTAWLEETDTPQGVSPEDRMALAAAMAELPPDVRACVSLCLADGFSNGEAALALGLPLGTVKSHVLRGRKRLLVALESDPPKGNRSAIPANAVNQARAIKQEHDSRFRPEPLRGSVRNDHAPGGSDDA